ncbi:MAG: transglutaminase domain-containing protein [Planctomycetes bacterium]|nr:transglutaminase domain-containing protein [Planctomycetota bacterium]
MHTIQLILPALFPFVCLGGAATRPNTDVKRMETHMTHVITLEKLPEGAETVRAWLPIPQSDDYQEISNLKIEPKNVEMHTDPVYKNKIGYLELKKPGKDPVKIEFSYDLKRVEETAHKEKDPTPDALKRFREGDHLAPINDKIKEFASKATEGKKAPVEKTRALYDFVIDYMNYSKEGTGWGNGDIQFACDAKRGNCSDYHALFIGMARAAGITARFHYGYSLKPDGTTAAHCWAEILDAEKGWFPVDCSEADKAADKDPSKKDYYFGTLSENRVLMSTGRDIVLEPKQAGEPVNFLNAPQVEVDGKKFTPKVDVSHQPKK